jgi:Tfp pilus assembly protein PilF
MKEFWGGHPRTPALMEEVRRPLERALELDPNLSAAHDTLGRVRLHYDYDWKGAEAAFLRAIELEPSSVVARNGYSLLLQTLMRYDEALVEAARAVALDPLSPLALAEEGRVFYRARRFAEAEERFHRALGLDPGFGSALDRLIQLYLAERRLPEAREALSRLETLPSHRPRAFTVLRAHIDAADGNRSAALKRLAALPDYPGGWARVVVSTALGDHERALSELDRVVTDKTMGPYAWANPELDPLRSDPRFAALVRRIGLPVDAIVGLGRAAPGASPGS